MAGFPKLNVRPSGQSGSGAEGKGANEPKLFPRVVLTEGAILPIDRVEKSATEKSDVEGTVHHLCSVGDVVMMTDAEFAAHQAAGVCLVNEDAREAA